MLRINIVVILFAFFFAPICQASKWLLLEKEDDYRFEKGAGSLQYLTVQRSYEFCIEETIDVGGLRRNESALDFCFRGRLDLKDIVQGKIDHFAIRSNVWAILIAKTKAKNREIELTALQLLKDQIIPAKYQAVYQNLKSNGDALSKSFQATHDMYASAYGDKTSFITWLNEYGAGWKAIARSVLEGESVAYIRVRLNEFESCVQKEFLYSRIRQGDSYSSWAVLAKEECDHVTLLSTASDTLGRTTNEKHRNALNTVIAQITESLEQNETLKSSFNDELKSHIDQLAYENSFDYKLGVLWHKIVELFKQLLMILFVVPLVWVVWRVMFPNQTVEYGTDAVDEYAYVSKNNNTSSSTRDSRSNIPTRRTSIDATSHSVLQDTDLADFQLRFKDVTARYVDHRCGSCRYWTGTRHPHPVTRKFWVDVNDKGDCNFSRPGSKKSNVKAIDGPFCKDYHKL